MNEPFGDDEIKKVHLVFMNHLDVGYDGIGVTGYAVNVINTYFRSYFPRAIVVAEALRTLGYEERFIYTTHPWLLDLYTNCPDWIIASGSLQCPNSTELASLGKAIRQGDITWHAAPMNMQYEMYFTHLLDVSLNISSRLDQRYDINRTHPVLSLRDVPGLTKAVIPILQKHNIAGVSVGINSGAAFPAVPPYPFLWKLDEDDATGVVAFWHNKGYPGSPGLTPATPGGLSRHDCHIPQRISQFPEALCFAFRQDNQGPPLSYTEVLNNFEVARGQFLNAKVQASTLDNFVGGLLAAKPTLPVSSQEIGDPWIFGVSSDPLKTIRYRAFGRALDACFESGNCSGDDPRIINMVRYLTKIPEHTWGLIRITEKHTNYSNADFRKKRAAGDYSNWETSWTEQRQFLDLSYFALKDHPLADQMLHEWHLTLVQKPNLTDYHEVEEPFQTFTCGDGTLLQFDSEGALQKMFEPYNNISWADSTHPIAQIMYTTYNETIYLDSARTEEHDQGHPRSKTLPQTPYPYPKTEWPMKLQHLYSKPLASTCDFWLELTPQDPEAVTSYGCPELFYVHIAVRHKAQNIDPETPTTTLETSDCPPIVQSSERLQGKIEWDLLDSLNCSQELFVFNYRVPEDYGFVLEFYLVKLHQKDTLGISSVEHGTEIEKKTIDSFNLDLAPLMLHTNNMKIVVCSQYGRNFRAKFNMSYKAHPRSSIPYVTKVTDSTLSRYIYKCYEVANLPEAISCDGVRHCEHGEDEKHCPYRDEGCGDWYPHNDQCITVILMDKLQLGSSYNTETVYVAEMNCERDDDATLAAFHDSAGQEIMKNMIRKSGGRHAAVGLRRVQPVSLKLSHLYRFVWQWGKRGSPIAYDKFHLQQTDALNDCAHLNIEGGEPWFEARPCIEWRDLDSFICMKPNPLRYTQSNTLTGLALPGATLAFKGFPTKTCSDGSLVQPFYTCQWGSLEEEDLASTLSPNNFPLFQCRYGQPIHYSLLCDGKPDCIDLSDEKDCRDPRFSPLLDSSFICRNSQEIANEIRCDGMEECFDGSDEEVCEFCKERQVLCSGLGCFPYYYEVIFSCAKFPMREDEFMDYDYPPPVLVQMGGFGLSWLLSLTHPCGEGLYQCQEGFCIPSFLLNNGERDCPQGEDEDIPVHNMTCPGYYRCQGSWTCVYTNFSCDGINHCPDKDDEIYCNLTCPHDSGCVCEGHAYKCSKMINPLDNLHVRYLDLSFAANVSLDNVHFIKYLVFLNLSFCRLANVTLRDMPQLQTLDLSSNLLTRLSSLSLVTLPGVIYLDLSHNPLVKTLTAEFTVMLQSGELQNLKVLNLVNVGLTGIDSNVFNPLSKLTHLDVRANQLGRYSKESLHGLVSLEDLYTDETNLCCPYFLPSVSRCHAPRDELSSCSDLLGKDIFKVCLWALAVLALVGNMGVLLYRLLLVRTRTALTAASILVKSLCASDMLMGVYLAMIGVADAQQTGTYVSREREWRSSVMCTVAGVLSLMSSEVSALLVSLITLDRVLVLCFPFKPQLHLTPRSTIFTCVGVWVAGVVLAVVPLLVGMEFYGQTSICIPLPITRQQFSGQHYAFGVFIIFNFVIFLFIGTGQLMIYLAVRKASAASGTASRSRDLTVARRLFMIVLTDFCCWFPVGVMGFLAVSSTPIPGEVNVWAAIFVLPLNSALNPFLYTLNALLERSRQQRRERKLKKIVATLQNEISNFNADTVKDVIKICVRSGQVGKDTVETMFNTTSCPRPQTNFDDE